MQVYVQPRATIVPRRETSASFMCLTIPATWVPLAAVTSVKPTQGPEFTMRYNLHEAAQINASAKPGYSSAQAMKAMEEVFQ